MNTDTSSGQGGEASRPLTPLEHQVISAIITDECPNATELRAQLDVATVSGMWKPVGSPSFDIEVPEGVPIAAAQDGVLPMNAHVYDGNDHYLGELLIWLSNGRLSSLEYAWVTDEMPQSLPAVELIRVGSR